MSSTENGDSTRWVGVARTDDIDDSDVQQCLVGDACIAVFNIGGSFYATSDICTHAHAHLSGGYIDGETVECPLHQGLFHIPTGKAIGPPVTEDLKTYPIRIENGTVFIKVDAI